MKRLGYKLFFEFFLILFATNAYLFATNNSTNIHYIGPWYGGFFASFMSVLNHLSWCEKNSKTPIVYWDKRSLYYIPQGFNNKSNAWEYYFKQTSNVPYNESRILIKELQFTPHKPDRVEFCQEYTDKDTRLRAYALITKYIRPRSSIRKKINDFYKKYMAGKPTIGIHLRGTDKFLECKLVSAEKIIAKALQNCSAETQFLIATDEQPLLDKMKILLTGRSVIYYDCYRSDNGVALHHNVYPPTRPGARQKPSLAQIGEDVLAEALLLSKCDFFIHSTSNVSSAVLYFNPTLEDFVVTQDA